MPTTPEPEALNATPRKRKHSTNEHGEPRVIKHRSSKACRSCRHRKVRCDVAAKGASRCTNCELDDMECVVLPSRRGHSHRIQRDGETSTSQPRSSRKAENWPESSPNRAQGAKHLPPSRPHHAGDPTGNVPAVVTFDEDTEDAAVPEQQHRVGGPWENGPSDQYEVLLTPETRTDTAPQQQSPLEKPLLPAFIAPLPTRTLAEDLEFLNRKGAFLLPEPSARVEIMRAYLFSVHPFMPMLEVGPFLRAVQSEDGQVSLLLFQAVMYAGLHSLPPDVVHRWGYQSPKQARQLFFDRARLLYDFNVEADSSAVLQSLILMSSWYSKYTPWNERRHTWHWTGLAYDLARSMGLHREPEGNNLAVDVRRFRRRLWWSLYIRDRMIALGTRRPMRIQDGDFDVGLLTLDDFEVELGADSSYFEGSAPDRDERLATALMCVELAKLGIIIGRVVSSQYTTLGSQAASRTMMVMPRRDGDHTEELQECERRLQAWSESLPGNVGRSESSLVRSPQSCIEVQWAQLNMTYLTVVNVLHRAEALRNQAESNASSSRSKVKNAARRITRLGQDMLQHDQIRYLGLIGVTALLAACLTHLLDAGSPDEDVRDASTFRLYQSLQVLQSLRDVYASADSAFSFLASVTRKAGIQLPLQPDPSSAAFASYSPSKLTSTKLPGHEPARATFKVHGSSSHQRNDSWLANDSHVFPSQPAGALSSQKPQYGGPGQSGDATQLSTRRTFHDDPTTAYVASNTAPLSGQNWTHVGTRGSTDQFTNTNIAESSNSAYADDGLDWHTSFDAGAGFESMSFNYDFFSDALGFLDGDMHGL